MNKIWNLTKSNLQKGKGQAFSFFGFVLLAALLMNIGLVTWFNYDRSFDQSAESLNRADVSIMMQGRESDLTASFVKGMREDSQLMELESRSILFSLGTFMFGEGELTRNIAILNTDDKTQISQILYMEKSSSPIESPVYLPWVFHTGGEYKIGDEFVLSLSAAGAKTQKFIYTVAGFFEETLLATINSNVAGIVLEEKEYLELAHTFQNALDGTMFLVRLHNPSEGEYFSAKHYDTLVANLPQTALSDSVFYEMIKQSRTVTSSIASMIVVAFSIIVTIICMIIVKFRIGNSIEEDMQNIGVLKAIGYTSWQIIFSILLLFVSIGTIGCVAGIGFSYLVLPFLSEMFAVQTGIIWNQRFDPFVALLTIFFILLAITLVSFFSSNKVRHLHPIMALRSGIMTHNFKINPFPLDCGKGNVLLRLSGKSFFQNTKQNIMMILIMSAVSFSAVFASVMYYNIVVEDQTFVKLVGGEVSDVQLSLNSNTAADELLLEISEMPQVEKSLYFDLDTVTNLSDGSEILCYITEDFERIENQDLAYKGRLPKFENEIALGGLLAKKMKKKIGDTITLTNDEKSAELLITGLIQTSNYLGRDACITEEGFRLLSPDYQPCTMLVYLNKGEDVSNFIQRVKAEQGEKIAIVTDFRKVLESSIGVYQGVVSIMVWIVLLITAVIIALTIYLVIKTLLIRKKLELGIQKAIGYTTRQLVMQTTTGFLPVVLIGSALGCVSGYFGVNPILSTLFSGIGMMKVSFTISINLLIGLCIGITLFAFLIFILVSVRIRKITPYMLMRE